MSETVIESVVEIPTSDGKSIGYLYRPAPEGRWPGVIQFTDIGGLRPSHRGMASRIATEGYTVLLPNVFYRSGEPPVIEFPLNTADPRTKQRIGELTTPLTPEAMERDAAAYVNFLDQQDHSNGGPMGVVGYCFTGSMALRAAAARADKISAAASFHGGGLFTDSPTSPHAELPRVRARLYFGHATEDRGMPKEAIEKFERALAAWGGKYQSETYDEARHGWTVPDSPAYNQPQAERAFQKLTDLLATAVKSFSVES